MRSRLPFFFALTGAGFVFAQGPPNSGPSPITTDRPAVTDSSTVVPTGGFVFENGFLETTISEHNGFDLPETLIRIGVVSKTEIRVTAPDYYENFNMGAGYGSGFGDLLIGLKQQLGPFHAFDISLVVSLSVPTGAKRLSSHGYDPQFQLPWSRSVSANWTAAGMFSFFLPTAGPKRVPTGQTAFLMDRQLNKRWDTFVEYAGTFASGESPQHLLHAGTSYKLTNDQQLDFHSGVGLSAASVDHIIGAGYSFRFQPFHH